jgi:hypothetical protein
VETRLVLATKQQIDGVQRKLGWFSRTAKGFYFEVGGLFFGSHTSYHKDGNIFRTSPVTDSRPSLVKQYLPLADFQGWHQLGISMLLKSALPTQSPLKARDQKGQSQVHEIDIDAYPSETLNFVVELIDPDSQELLQIAELHPPSDAQVEVFRVFQPWLVLTTMGHDDNLLVRPTHDGFVLSHFNNRYSASRPGQQYRYEAYKDER